MCRARSRCAGSPRSIGWRATPSCSPTCGARGSPWRAYGRRAWGSGWAARRGAMRCSRSGAATRAANSTRCSPRPQCRPRHGGAGARESWRPGARPHGRDRMRACPRERAEACTPSIARASGRRSSASSTLPRTSSTGPRFCRTIAGSGSWTAPAAAVSSRWRPRVRSAASRRGSSSARCSSTRSRRGPWPGSSGRPSAREACGGQPLIEGGRNVNSGERRVVITGVGAVTPIGTGAEGLWAGLAARVSAVRTMTRFDPTPFRSKIAAEIPDFRPQDHLDAKRAKRLDRFSQLAVTSARFALADAALDPRRENGDRVGAMMGSALGGVAFAEAQVERFRAEGPRGLDPALALAVFAGAASCNIAIEFGFSGPNSTNAMSCASGTIAVGDAFHTIRAGRADVMLAGGAEAPLAPMTFAAFSVIRAMSTRNDDPAHASRPFDEERDGFVMGEGAAVLVLEEREHAIARGAKIYAELAGYAFTNDAYHMTAPRPDGRQAARAMQLALADAHVPPAEVGYINAHASATPLNDATETVAIKRVFGDHAYRLSVSGTKGYYGHALGASGAIEAAICALALERRWLPPTLNLEHPDPACDLDCLPGHGRAAAPELVLTNSFGFGGINASLVLRRA